MYGDGRPAGDPRANGENMKTQDLRVSLVVTVGLALAGCMSPYGQPDYTASGTLAGAATGALIGSTTGHHGEGALVGGVVGAVAGGLVGHAIDQEHAAQLRTQAPKTLERVEQGQPLMVADVKALAKAGVSDDVIISQIRNSHTVYRLSTAEIVDLKSSGVNEKVIDFMINTPSSAGSSAVVAASTPPPPPIVEQVVVAPGPGYLWVDGCWFWYGSHWMWHRGYWHRPYYSPHYVPRPAWHGSPGHSYGGPHHR
jgi:hypothetical protein